MNIEEIDKDMKSFNDGIDGIMELPNMDEKRNEENSNVYAPRKMDLQDLNRIKNNFTKIKNDIQKQSNDRKKELESRKTLYGVNRRCRDRENIPGYNKNKVKWIFPNFQRVEKNGKIVQMGSGDYDKDELGQMEGINDVNGMGDNMNVEMCEEANSILNEIRGEDDDTSVRTQNVNA